MKTIRRFIYREILRAVAFVGVAFLLLFVFFDLVDQLQYLNSAGGYPLSQVLLFVTLRVPNHIYQLLPIAVLIGAIYVMARLAESSEYTILRTSGLGPLRALGMLLALAGWAVWLGNAAALLALPLFVAVLNTLQIRPEEAALRARFGADYARYAQRVRRWA